jgi:very-short-patch-repair endonuclease
MTKRDIGRPVQGVLMGRSAAEVVRHFGGRADRVDLLRHVTPHEIARAVATGDLLRATRGVYVLPQLPDEQAVAASCRGVLSHSSAALAHGLGLVFPPDAVHVTAARGARPALPKTVVLHRSHLEPGELDGQLTSMVRTVMDCCASLPFREALAVADAAAQRIDVDDLLRAADVPTRGRARRMKVMAAVDARSANAFESALRGSLIEGGMRLTPQVTIATAAGEFRVDLADERRRTAVEADSHAWHGSRSALSRDCRRYDELVRAGWRVLRFSWEQVMFDEDWVVEVVRGVLGRRRAA